MTQKPETEAQLPKTKGSWVKVAGTVISLLLFIWLMTRFGWQELLASMLQIKPAAIFAAFVLMVLSRFAVSLRWYFLCRSNAMKISLSNAIQLTFAGLYASNFLPSTIGGDVVRYLGGVQLDNQKIKCAGSLIMDRLVGMFGMILMLPYGLVYLLPLLMEGKLNLAGAKAGAGLSVVFMDRMRVLYQKVLKALAALLVQIGDWVKHPISLILPLLMTGVHMVLLFAIISLIFNGMGDSIPFLLIGGLYSVGYFITLIPISINGYGLQEISMTILFVNIANVSTSHAVIMALMVRFMMMAASLPGMFLLPKILPDRNIAN